MAQGNHSSNSGSIAIFPNPFKDRLNIHYQTANENRISIKIYDVAGRLVKQFTDLQSSINQITWNGDDENERTIPQGIYFLCFENFDTRETYTHKVLRIR